MSPSWIQILIVAVVIVLLFGRGRIVSLMGEVAQGIKSFRKGMSEEPAPPPPLNVSPKTGAEQQAEKTQHDEKSGGQ